MAKKSKSPFEGRWRITSMKMWSQDVVDAEVEGFVEFGPNGLGSFQFAYVSGDINYRDSTRDGKPSVEWSWDGHDEMDRAKGTGWAVIDGDKIHGVIAIQPGDQSEFEAIRKEQTDSKKRAIKKPLGKAEKPRLFNEQAAALAKNATLAYLDADERGVKNKTVEQFPLDGDERATVAALPVLPAILKKKLEKKVALTVVDVISFVVVISESFADAEPKKQMALLGIAQKLMDCLKENIVKPKSAGKAKKGKSTSTAYQLKITLADIKPPIWRRIQVPDCTLLKLNKVIQVCMGWEDCHMWLFEIGDEEYGDDVIDAGGDNDFASARKFKLSRFVQAGVKKFRYTYDMGDNWEHVIQVEKVLEVDPQATYPRCVEGSRACPPEDCGGPPGYGEYVAAIADPHHEQHEEMLEWRGPFDPEAFDIQAVNKELATLR
jgi:hypothetical protein